MLRGGNNHHKLYMQIVLFAHADCLTAFKRVYVEVQSSSDNAQQVSADFQLPCKRIKEKNPHLWLIMTLRCKQTLHADGACKYPGLTVCSVLSRGSVSVYDWPVAGHNVDALWLVNPAFFGNADWFEGIQ